MFTKEDYTPELIKELSPLIAAHRDEISLMPDTIPTEPNWAMYQCAADQDLLHIYTVRVEGIIQGYAVYMTYAHQHYISQLIAEPDVIYLYKEARRGMVGRDLLRFAERDLKALGVNSIRQVVKPSVRDFGPLLKRDGYELTDVIWTKRLR